MKFWRIRVDDEGDGTAWLVLTDELTAVGIYLDAGEIRTDVVEYTTIDTEAAPPDWAANVPE